MGNKRDWIELRQDLLHERDVAEYLRHPRAGAISVFAGTTRQFTGGRETERLEYECYEEMALAEMRRIVRNARSRWPLHRVCILHRLGEVPVTESSVIVGVSSTHRKDSFPACRYLIDTLKGQVPIWKREYYTDGTTEWVGGNLPGPASVKTIR